MKRLAFLWILLFASQLFAQQQKVTMNFSLWDKNERFDGELKSADIEIKQGNSKLQIISIEKVINEALDIVLMIDASGSQEKTLEAEKIVALKFIENIIKKDKDRLAIVKFAQTVDVEQDFSSDISKSVNTIKSINLQKLGRRNTSLWDSVQKVADVLKNTPSNKAIVLISDGVDNASKTTLDEITKYLIKLQIPLYSIEIRGDYLGTEGSLYLENISKQTGGFPFFPKDDEKIQLAALQTGQSLRQNFKITFLADNSKQTDKMQKVEISIINPSLKKAKLRIIQPKGFFFSNSK